MRTSQVYIVSPSGVKIKRNGKYIMRRTVLYDVHVDNNSDIAQIASSDYQVAAGGSLTIPVTYSQGYDYRYLKVTGGTATPEGIVVSNVNQDILITVISDMSPKTDYYQFTNIGSSSITLYVYSGTSGEAWVDTTSVGSFSAGTQKTITLPAGSILKLRGFSARTNTSNSDISTTSGDLTLDRFAESSTILYYTFSGMTSLKAITSWEGAQNIVTLRDAFVRCSNLTTLPSSWVGLNSLNTMIGTFNGTGLTGLPLSWTGLENLVTFQDVFNGSPIANIPDSWAGLERVTTMRGTFNGCRSIPAIPESWSGLSSIRYFTNVFENCSGIKTGGSLDTNLLSNILECNRAFYNLSQWTGDALAIYNALSQSAYSGSHSMVFYNDVNAVGYSSIPSNWKTS